MVDFEQIVRCPIIRIKGRPKVKMTEKQKGYLAAIIDGEGTITLTKDGEFRYPTIQVTSTTYDIIDFLKKNFGGAISKKNEQLRNPKWKQAYNWKLERRKAIELLEEIVGLLQEPKKKARAELIIRDYIRLTPRNGRYNEELRQKKHEFEEQFFKL